MSNNLGVNIAQLEATAVKLREKKEIMSEKLDSISSAVEQVDSILQSDATKDMRAIAAQMSDRFSEIKKEVEGFAIRLDVIIENYKNATANASDQTSSMNNLFSKG